MATKKISDYHAALASVATPDGTEQLIANNSAGEDVRIPVSAIAAATDLPDRITAVEAAAKQNATSIASLQDAKSQTETIDEEQDASIAALQKKTNDSFVYKTTVSVTPSTDAAEVALDASYDTIGSGSDRSQNPGVGFAYGHTTATIPAATTTAAGLLSAADKATLDAAAAAADRNALALGHYSDRATITLTPTQTGVAISSAGTKVTKAGWAIAEFTAEKGNEYLFKPGETDGAVCIFAEYIDKQETRVIDYTYTYNSDGTIATATATYGGKTYNYTYAYSTDAAGNKTTTITDTSTKSVVDNLPLVYTTTAGTYSPLVRLNSGAELPTDGYCRFMSHFQGNTSLKVVVSYKVGSADLTMLVLRDGVFASISTQLGNLSQKQSETAELLTQATRSYIDVMAKDETYCYVNNTSNKVTIPKKQKVRLFADYYFSIGQGWEGINAKKFIHCNVSHLDTSKFTDMSSMFTRCSSLTALDVSGWDTSKVTNMGAMFWECLKLTSLDVSGFDTSKVTTMGYMFSGCSSLTSLDVSGFDTSKVTNMGYMFSGCSSLTSLDVSGFDTSKVTTMGYMFQGCSSLTSLDVSGFDTSKVTNMRSMFYDCSSLTSLDVSGFDTSKVTSMSTMFYGCSSLTSLDVSGFDTSKVTDMNRVFSNSYGLTTLDVSGWDCTAVTDATCIFEGLSKLTTLIGTHTLAEVEAGTCTALSGLCVSLNVQWSTKLPRASLLALIKGLATVTTSPTITFSNSAHKSLLTDDDVKIATDKGWTVAFA